MHFFLFFIIVRLVFVFCFYFCNLFAAKTVEAMKALRARLAKRLASGRGEGYASLLFDPKSLTHDIFFFLSFSFLLPFFLQAILFFELSGFITAGGERLYFSPMFVPFIAFFWPFLFFLFQYTGSYNINMNSYKLNRSWRQSAHRRRKCFFFFSYFYFIFILCGCLCFW